MTNAEIADLLGEIATYLEMEGVAFKPRAYARAAESIAGAPDEVSELFAEGGRKALEALPGVGKSVAEKVVEALETGSIGLHEELRERVPVDLGSLLAVEGLGPKSVKILWEELGIRDAAGLEEAARAGKVRELPGFGKRSEAKMLESLELVRTNAGRLPLEKAEPIAEDVAKRLAAVEGVERVEVAGSLRRRKATIGDLDFLVVAEETAPVMEAFVGMPEVVQVHGHGETKSSVRLAVGIDADLRVVPEASFGAALQYFTGSKDHNVELRKRAIAAGLRLNEYGVFRGEQCIAGATEEDVYAALGVAWLPPEERLDGSEIEATTGAGAASPRRARTGSRRAPRKRR